MRSNDYKISLVNFIKNPALKGFFLFVVVFQFMGCDAIYRMLQREGAEERDILGEIVPNEINEKVFEVQKLLKLYGYKVGNPDGVLGANTRNAIASFQQDNGLKVSRFVDKATWQKLNIFQAYGLISNGELNLTAIQTAIKNAGLDPGPVDGKRGRRTEQAIKDFQKQMGLKPDGKIGLRTLKALASYLSANTAL